MHLNKTSFLISLNNNNIIGNFDVNNLLCFLWRRLHHVRLLCLTYKLDPSHNHWTFNIYNLYILFTINHIFIVQLEQVIKFVTWVWVQSLLEHIRLYIPWFTNDSGPINQTV